MSNRRKYAVHRRLGRKGMRRIQILLILLVGLLRVDSAQWLPSAEPAWIAHATHVGRTDRVTLQDGSRVDLNTDSEIKVRFAGGERQIVLLHGEALFTVVHRPDWPFSVRAGVATIRAVGTRFSVRLRDNQEAEIIVIEGRIAIEGGRQRESGGERPGHIRRRSTTNGDTGAPLASPLIATVGHSRDGSAREGSADPLIAFAGEQISLNPMSELSVTELTAAALKRSTAWTDGWIWFAQAPLPEAIAEFNRYHRRRLVLVDPELASLEIGGRFRSTDLDSFIATLEHSFHVRAHA